MSAEPPRRARREIDREIARLAVPALGALLAEPLYLLADTAVIARLGTTELAGFGVAASILATAIAPLLFLAYATTSTVARRVGAGDHAGAGVHAVQAMWLALLIGVALVVGGALGADRLVALFGSEPAVAAGAVVYLRVALLGIPAMLVVFAGTGYLRGLQDVRTPLVVAAVSAAGNLVLELVLIVGLGFGLAASALATVVAQWGAAAVYVVAVVRASRARSVPLRPDFAELRGVARISGDLFVRTLALRGAFLSMTFVAARLGTESLAASEVAFSIFIFLAFGLDALAIAAQSMVGLRVGAGDVHRIEATVERLVWWGAVFGSVAGVILAIGHRVIAGAITDDPAVAAHLAALLLVLAVMQPVAGVVFVLDGVFIGAGDMRYLAKAMAISLAAFLPCAAAVIVTGADVTWLWASLIVFMLARLATLWPRRRALRRGPA